MHQENFLSSSLREDVEGKEGERRRMDKDANEEEIKSRKREVEEKRERFDFNSERTCLDR